MFRHALVAYMLLLSLAGPSPCCCVIAPLANSANLTNLKAQRGEALNVAPLTCCGKPHDGDSAEQQAEPSSCCRVPSSSDAQGPGGGCRCERNLCATVPSPQAEFTIELKRSWQDDLALNRAVPLMLEADDFVAQKVSFDGTPPAARSGRETRVVLQSWQC